MRRLRAGVDRRNNGYEVRSGKFFCICNTYFQFKMLKIQTSKTYEILCVHADNWQCGSTYDYICNIKHILLKLIKYTSVPSSLYVSRFNIFT